MVNWTIFKVLSWTESYFKSHSIESPRLAAEILLGATLGVKRLDLYLQYDRPLQDDELSEFKHLIKRRIQHEPVAYITGEKGFWEAEFSVEKGVLIPRPDTETLVEHVIRVLNSSNTKNEPKKILELGTGSGAIIISLAQALGQHHYFANDISCVAVNVARKNARKIVNDKINFFLGSWFSSLKEKVFFDIIVSNPPYIPSADIQTLAPEIKDYEPELALDGGKNGLDCIAQILKYAHKYLVPGGMIFIEMGFDQKQGVINIVKRYPVYQSVDFIKDLSGHDRVALIKK
ncbi:MAG: peptide chain release factor N(5)-glutamine methyltransferase [Desulfobacteraceae bacterium]|nr:peptide chain release factor N(5)-glutamine methyltransferase [Desulfobacteraceae bacterium]